LVAGPGEGDGSSGSWMTPAEFNKAQDSGLEVGMNGWSVEVVWTRCDGARARQAAANGVGNFSSGFYWLMKAKMARRRDENGSTATLRKRGRR